MPIARTALTAAVGLVWLAAVLVPGVPSRAEVPADGYANGAIAAVSPPAVDIGVEVLKKGGNAVDAAIAVAFAMAVTYPSAGNVGGGGFMLVHPAPADLKKGAKPTVIEYRETAPAAARADTFAKDTDILTHRAVGVPGTVRGMHLAHQKFGKLSWKELLAPAVRLADEGFAVDAQLAFSLNNIVGESAGFPELRRCLGKNNGTEEWNEGDRWVQKDLARTLKLVAEDGPDAFYTGPIADLIAAEMKSGKGLITKADLAAYQANVREPIHGTFRGFDVYGPPPPSSGGTTLVEMLNILEPFDLKKQGRYAPETVHLMAEAMRRAYLDRARYLGDADFVKIPPFLNSKEYGKKLAQGIDPKKATRSEDLAGDIPLAKEGDNTTHFSVVDKDGMCVANTYTLERSYGSRIVVKGAGFLLNNEMIDFNWQPGVTDRTGRIGTPANQVAPGKRMLSSQTPCVVAKDGRPVLITGSPGSRTIINTVLCVVLNVTEFGMTAREAVDAPRMHHGWFPDEIRLEDSGKEGLRARLEAMGHTIRGTRQGDAHSIGIDPKTGRYFPAEDRRINGRTGGY